MNHTLLRSGVMQMAQQREVSYIETSLRYDVNIREILDLITLTMVHCGEMKPIAKSGCFVM